MATATNLGADAVLLVGFGGPEGPEEVLPFLRNVTRGRDVPEERLAEVAEQYAHFGGVSPINTQCRALLAALRDELTHRGRDVPVYWGNRNWDPHLADTVADITRDGHRRVVAVATSAYASYSACRQYLEDIDRARRTVGDAAPRITKIGPYWDHPGFVAANVARVTAAFDSLDDDARGRARLVCTAHSLPVSMAADCAYESQLRSVAAAVADQVGAGDRWDLVFQSRSGPPTMPWLEPDIDDHLRLLAKDGVDTVVLAPIGFTSDHMEIAYDLDTKAAAVAHEVGVRLVRAHTVGTHPRFVGALVDRLEPHLDGDPGSPCAPGCCPAPARPPAPDRR